MQRGSNDACKLFCRLISNRMSSQRARDRSEQKKIDLEDKCRSLEKDTDVYLNMIKHWVNLRNELKKENDELRGQILSHKEEGQHKEAQTKLLERDADQLNQVYNQQKLLIQQHQKPLEQLHQEQELYRVELMVLKGFKPTPCMPPDHANTLKPA